MASSIKDRQQITYQSRPHCEMNVLHGLFLEVASIYHRNLGILMTVLCVQLLKNGGPAGVRMPEHVHPKHRL